MPMFHHTVEANHSEKASLPLRESNEHFPCSMNLTDKKLVIAAAISGWHPFRWWEESRVKHLPPRNFEAQIDEILERLKVSASEIHTNPRYPSDGLPRLYDSELLVEIMDRIFKEVDFVTYHHTWTRDFFRRLPG